MPVKLAGGAALAGVAYHAAGGARLVAGVGAALLVGSAAADAGLLGDGQIAAALGGGLRTNPAPATKGTRQRAGEIVRGRAFKVLGSTQDVTQCDCCGRDDLRGTVVLQPLDADGGAAGEPVYFGNVCAAKSMRQTVKYVRAELDARTREESAARQAAHDARARAYSEWLTQTYGPRVKQPGDLWSIGVKPLAALERYHAERPDAGV